MEAAGRALLVLRAVPLAVRGAAIMMQMRADQCGGHPDNSDQEERR